MDGAAAERTDPEAVDGGIVGHLRPGQRIVLAGGYLALTAAGSWAAMQFEVDQFSVLFPPAALALAYLVLVGPKGAPVVIVARLAFVTPLSAGVSWPDSLPRELGRALVVTAVYLAAAMILRRIGMHHARLRQFGWFAVVGVFGAPLVAAAGVAVVDVAVGDATLASAGEGARVFWTGDAVAVATITPVILLAAWRWRFGQPVRRPPLTWTRRVEAAAQALAVVLVPVVALALGTARGPTPLLGLAVLPALWVALRHDLLVGAVGVLVLNTVIAAAMAHGVGVDLALVELQTVMLAGALGAYYVGAQTHTTEVIVDELRSREERFKALLDSLPELVVTFDRNGSVISSNSPPARCGTEATDRAIVDQLRSSWRQQGASVAAGGGPRQHEWALDDGDGQRWFDTHFVPQHSGAGEVSGIMTVTANLTPEREARARLEHERLHEALTGLPNRRAGTMLLEELLASEEATTGASVAAVVGVDLDRFHLLNQSLGHAVGDAVLGDVARRLQQCAERNRAHLMHLGGDEFALAVLCPPDGAAAQRCADDALDAVRAPLHPALGGSAEGIGVILTASVGVRVAGDADIAPDQLLHDAEVAVNAAKELGRDRVVVFDDEQRREARDRQRRIAGLHAALANDELIVHFQPEVDLRSGDIVGFEALVRWRTADGLVPPGEFVPLAEELGLDVDLGTRVFDRSFAAAAAWPEGDRQSRPTLSVNVTARHMVTAGFVDDLVALAERHGLDPCDVRLELTETSIMTDPERAAAVIAEVRRCGATVALDDFGTGYSSISQLQRLGVDVLKIDRSFVAGLPDDSGARAIVSLVVGLGEALGIAVTAEGVETEAQRQCLVELGCGVGQGYLFDRPADHASTLDLLARVHRYHVGRPADVAAPTPDRDATAILR
ncbi:MAG: EAL domain-containing protein [Acidimicrobiia bacterium]|nr:EAL domain-containing protein [Acidimicrobiia bacterium]